MLKSYPEFPDGNRSIVCPPRGEPAHAANEEAYAMELLSVFVENILPIFIVAGIGFLIVRYLGADVRTLSRVTLYVLTPCLLFDVLVTSDVRLSLRSWP
jgi:hypothetical protein